MEIYIQNLRKDIMNWMETNEAIQNCIECHIFCLSTWDKKVGMELARTLSDCAQMCITTADFMTRNSPIHIKLCESCADCCEDLAIACKKTNDDSLDEIAEICVKCADSCRLMARRGAETFMEKSGSKNPALI